jgi:predicted PurR-regulated permease PerM
VINLNLNNTATRWGLNLLIILAVIAALYLGRSIFIPTIIALLFAAMLWPAITYLHGTGVPIPFVAWRSGFPWVFRLKISWNAASMFLVMLMMAVAMGITAGFGLAIPKMMQGLPRADLPDDDPRSMQVAYSKFRERLHAVGLPLDQTYLPDKYENSQLVQTIGEAINPKKSTFVLDTLRSVGDIGLRWLVQWVLVMFILLFLLMEGRMLTRRVVEIFGPSPAIQSKVGDALKDMAMQIRVYLVWRTIINFALALFLGIIYQILGLSQPWTWALLTAILWYVPYLGPIIAGVPPVIDAFVSFEPPGLAPWVAISLMLFYVLVVTVEGYLIVPLVMGRSMELNATTVMLACLFWELVWGTSGLFLAMPLMAAIKAICWHVPDWKPFANLMSTRDDEPPENGGGKDFDNYFGGDTQLLTLEDAEALQAGGHGDTAIGRLEE